MKKQYIKPESMSVMIGYLENVMEVMHIASKGTNESRIGSGTNDAKRNDFDSWDDESDEDESSDGTYKLWN
jgi:hypothetical protein